MLISSKGRYGLRLMVYMTQATDGSDTVALRKVASAEGISLKYLEQLASAMVRAGYLKSVRGREGGYTLDCDPSKVTAGDVLRAAEGQTPTVACAGLEDCCPRENICSTVVFWAGLDHAIDEYVDGVTLDQLAGEGTKLYQTLAR